MLSKLRARAVTMMVQGADCAQAPAHPVRMTARGHMRLFSDDALGVHPDFTTRGG